MTSIQNAPPNGPDDYDVGYLLAELDHLFRRMERTRSWELLLAEMPEYVAEAVVALTEAVHRLNAREGWVRPAHWRPRPNVCSSSATERDYSGQDVGSDLQNRADSTDHGQ